MYLLKLLSGGTPSYELITRLIITRLQMTMETIDAVDTPWMKITLWNTAEKEWQEHPFSNYKFIQSVLDDVRVKCVCLCICVHKRVIFYSFFRLPECIEPWTLLQEQQRPSCKAPSGVHCQTAPVYTIHTKFKVPKNRCPFNADEAPAWTAAQRGKAASARPVTSLKHLEAEVKQFLVSMLITYRVVNNSWSTIILMPVRKKIPTDISVSTQAFVKGAYTYHSSIMFLIWLDRQTVVIRDADAEPVAVIIPNMLSHLPHLRDSIVAQLRSTWNGEFEQDKSDRQGYSYYCWHGDWWNRYTERVCYISFFLKPPCLKQCSNKDMRHPRKPIPIIV